MIMTHFNLKSVSVSMITRTFKEVMSFEIKNIKDSRK